MAPDASRFHGRWELIAELSEYESGEPPRDGVYEIQPTKAGLAFSIQWHEQSGKAQAVSFSLTWAGDEPASLELVDSGTLNTAIEKNDRVTAFATRRLSDDGSHMEIVQQGFTPQGTPFTNKARYRRIQ